MKFQIGDRHYEYDGKILVADAMFIFEKSQVGLSGLNRALLGDGSQPGDGNPFAIAAWCFLLKRRAGEAVRYEDILKIDIATYRPIHDETPAKEDAAEKPSGDAVDPPSPNGTSRKRASTRTS